jgi:hypothetical protein
MVVTLVVNIAEFCQTSFAWLIFVPLVKSGTVHMSGATVGWGVPLGAGFTGSPVPANAVRTTEVELVSRSSVSPTMLPMSGVASVKVAATVTRYRSPSRQSSSALPAPEKVVVPAG